MEKNNIILITGAGGFVGGHLVRMLRDRSGLQIRAVDIKPLDSWFQKFSDVENLVLDLELLEDCQKAASNCEHI